MFNQFFESLREKTGNDEITTKRRHERREADKCVSVINDKTYPVENWSMGGVLIHADSRPFGVDNEIDITLKFKLRDNIMDVGHKARVIRKSRDKVALEFMPLTGDMRKNLQNVVDDYVASKFADSQLS